MAKTISRWAGGGGAASSSALFANLADSPICDEIKALRVNGEPDRAAEKLLEHFRTSLPARFFSGVCEPETSQSLANSHPEHCSRTISSADAICDEQFEILGYGRISYGSPVDWHFDPIARRRTALAHWTRIELEHEAVGDIKVVWEVNRHQWLLDLGQAWLLTGDEKYAQTFVRLVQEWIEKNPPELGINWTSALEVALRMISWCWALALFRDAKSLSAEFYVSLLNSIRLHANYVERYLSTYFSPNTHLTGEALGLFYVGSLFPEFTGSKRWADLGAGILIDQLPKQVYSDGVYFEQSACYQHYTTEFYQHFLILSEINQRKLPVAVSQRLQQMLEFQLAMRQPNGLMPQFGDSDGGWLLPLCRRLPGDDTALFATGAVLLERSDLAWAAGGETVETRWLLGKTGGRIFGNLDPVAPANVAPILFEQGGYAVLRSDWSAHAHHMVMDTGPLGCPVSGVHGHADLLSLHCCAFGEPYLVDSGNYCYAVDGLWRDYFRNSWSHNTVLVDGLSQLKSIGPFGWQFPRPTAHLNHSESNKLWQLVDAGHSAFEHLPDSVSHRRQLVFVDSRYWVVVDELTGSEEHEIELRYQFAPISIEAHDDGWVRAKGIGGQALLLRAFSAVSLDRQIENGKKDPLRGWISPRYGQYLAAPALKYYCRTRLPLRIATLVLPLADADGQAPDVSVQLRGGSLTGLGLNLGDIDNIRFDTERVSVERVQSSNKY